MYLVSKLSETSRAETDGVSRRGVMTLAGLQVREKRKPRLCKCATRAMCRAVGGGVYLYLTRGFLDRVMEETMFAISRHDC